MASSNECNHMWQMDNLPIMTCFLCDAEKLYIAPPTKLDGIKASVTATLKGIGAGIGLAFSAASYYLKDWRVLACVLAAIVATYFAITFDYVQERDPTGSERYAVETISCTHYDYCYACDQLNAKGEVTCGFRYGTCNGSQEAKIHYTEWLYTRKSGKQQISERSRVSERLTECE